MKGKDMKESCECGCGCHSGKKIGACMLLLAVLVLLNDYFVVLSWPMFIGIIIAIKALMIMIKPCK